MHRWQFSHEHNLFARVVSAGALYPGPSPTAVAPLPFKIYALDTVQNCIELELDGKRIRAHFFFAAHTVGLVTDGFFFRLSRVSHSARDAAQTAAGELRAEIPGRIVKIPVPVGKKAEAGETLVIQEAMKMELAIRAPRRCTVDEILVQEGDQVDADALLIRWSGVDA